MFVSGAIYLPGYLKPLEVEWSIEAQLFPIKTGVDPTHNNVNLNEIEGAKP